MFSVKIPDPINIDLKKNNSIEEIIDYVYYDYFKTDFMDKKNREKLNNKFIYFDLCFIEYKPERFWHIISFDPNEEKYTVDPCVNTNDSLICKNTKSKCNTRSYIPNETQLENRYECIYRMRRINWINPIIKLANQKDDSVKVWHQDEIDTKNGVKRKVFIRFQDGLADYVIVLIDGTITGKKGYKFVTAYPVVHNGTKRRLNRSYFDYMKKLKRKRKQKSRSQ